MCRSRIRPFHTPPIAQNRTQNGGVYQGQPIWLRKDHPTQQQVFEYRLQVFLNSSTANLAHHRQWPPTHHQTSAQAQHPSQPRCCKDQLVCQFPSFHLISCGTAALSSIPASVEAGWIAPDLTPSHLLHAYDQFMQNVFLSTETLAAYHESPVHVYF